MFFASIQRNFGRWSAVALWLAVSIGCTSVPVQVAQLHQKEGEILLTLEKAHLAMIDSFVDQKLLDFESFMFTIYGPLFRDNWEIDFPTVHGRDYDPAKDFALFYNDLVAEYQAESAPIEVIRKDLRSAITAEYGNAHKAHQAVGNWLASVQELNAIQKQSFNTLLGTIKPGINLDSIDAAVKEAIDKVQAKIDKLSANI